MTSMVASALDADASTVIEPILAEMDIAIVAIRKQIAGFEEIKTSARTVVGGGAKILNRARLMEEEIAKRLSVLTSQLDRLRATTAEGGG